MNAPAPLATQAAAADPALRAAILAEAVPYLRRYAGKTIVVKYGGHAMGAGGETFAHDIALVKQVLQITLQAKG